MVLFADVWILGFGIIGLNTGMQNLAQDFSNSDASSPVNVWVALLTILIDINNIIGCNIYGVHSGVAMSQLCHCIDML